MSTLDPNLQILDFDGVIRFPGVEGFPDCLLNDLQRRVSELSVTDVSGTGPQARRGLWAWTPLAVPLSWLLLPAAALRPLLPPARADLLGASRPNPLQRGLIKTLGRHCFPPVLLNSGPAACHSEAHAWEASASGKERLLYFRGWQLEEKADLCPKTSSPLTSSRQKLLKKKKKKKYIIWLCRVLVAAPGSLGFCLVVAFGLQHAQTRKPCGMWDLSSGTRDQTCVPCIGRWSPKGKNF